jgi:hypothetical protein
MGIMYWAIACCLWTNSAVQIPIKARFEASRQHLFVRYCEDRELKLLAPSNLFTDALIELEPQPVSRSRRQMKFQLGPGQCAQLRVDIGLLAAQRRSEVGWRVGSDLLTWSNAWLWRPVGNRATNIEFELPPGYAVAAPWLRIELQPGLSRFQIPEHDPSWPSMVAFGRFETLKFEYQDATVYSTMLGASDTRERERINAIASALPKQLLAAYGRLPLPQLEQIIIPVSRDGEQAIIFGQIERGGTGAMQLFINPKVKPEHFLEHWIPAHELAHLLHPYLEDGRGRWLSEGLASYYQNVLRARSGALTPKAAWRHLLAGFARGRADRATGTLDEIADDMQRQRAYMRVYWSGARYWLEQDLHLRSQGDSLDAVLERFARKHLPATKPMHSSHFLALLDAQLEQPLFAPSADRFGALESFPSTAEFKLESPPMEILQAR